MDGIGVVAREKSCLAKDHILHPEMDELVTSSDALHARQVEAIHY